MLTALAVDSIEGFLSKPDHETILIAASIDQARLAFDPILYVLDCGKGGSREDEFNVKNSSAGMSITRKDNGARIRLISSDYKRAHGLRPNLILADEPAQWPPAGERLCSALATALGKRQGAKLLLFGTRPRDETHFFARLLRDEDPSVYTLCYAATDKDKWDSVKTWRRVNPALKFGLIDIEVLKAEARRAKTDPNLLAAFKALRLNMGTDEAIDRDILVSPEQWRPLLDRTPAEREGKPVWGLDLGGSVALSAVAACWSTGRLETLAMFGSQPNLEKRSLADGVGELYNVAFQAGELLISGKRIPDINELILTALERFGRPSALVCDRWRVDELRDVLDAATMKELRGIEIITRGQGFKDGSEAVRAFQKAVSTAALYPVKPSILLTSGLGEAVIVSDPAGNSKLAKNTQGGRRKNARDDVVSAALLAVEFGLKERKQSAGYYGLI